MSVPGSKLCPSGYKLFDFRCCCDSKLCVCVVLLLMPWLPLLLFVFKCTAVAAALRVGVVVVPILYEFSFYAIVIL